MQQSIPVSTSKKQELIDITRSIQDILDKTNTKEGLCNVYVQHTSAGLVINENADPNLPLDIVEALNKLVPSGIWKHDAMDGNADAHIKASLVGQSQTIPVKDNKLQLGTWQGIMFAEFDGPRERKVLVTVK